MRKFKVYVVNSDTIIVDAETWNIVSGTNKVFFYKDNGTKVVGVFNLDNIQGFKEVK